jgi:hypothetical protein
MRRMIILAALFNAGFAIFHMFFWRLFGWPASLEPAGKINAGIIQVLNLCIIFVFLAIGGVQAVISLTADADSIAPLMLGIAAFWLFRAVLQPLFFPLRHKTSALLFFLFLAGSAIHALPVLLN